MNSITLTAKATKNARRAGGTTSRKSRASAPQLDSKGSTPVESASLTDTQLHQLLLLLRQSDRSRSRQRARVLAKFSNHPPYSAEQLRQEGLSHPANLPRPSSLVLAILAVMATVSADRDLPFSNPDTN